MATDDIPVLINGGADPTPVLCLSVALSPMRLLIVHGDAEEFDERFIRALAVMRNIVIVQKTEQHVVLS